MKYLLYVIIFLSLASSLWAAGDTLIVLRSAGADSTGWEDTYVNAYYTTTNYSTDANTWWGELANDDVFVLSRQSALVGVIPAGKHCDSAMYCMVIVAQSGTDTVFAKVHRALRNWVLGEVTWTIYSTGNNWGTGGGQSDGVDRLAAAEQATNIIREPHTAWFSYIDGDSIAGADTVMAQLNPNTIDSISDGTLTNNGWLFQFNVATTTGVGIRGFARDYDSDASSKSLRRPFMRIYCSDDGGAATQTGQVIIIGGN